MQDNIFDNKAMLKDTKAFFDIFANKFNLFNIVEKYIFTIWHNLLSEDRPCSHLGDIKERWSGDLHWNLTDWPIRR